MLGTAFALVILRQYASTAPEAGVTIEMMRNMLWHLLKIYLLLVCGLALGAWAASAEPVKPETPELPVLLTTVGGTQVILRDMQAAEHRLVLELHHPDVTDMPPRSELRLAFDTQVAEVSKPKGPMPLRLDAAVASPANIAVSGSRPVRLAANPGPTP